MGGGEANEILMFYYRDAMKVLLAVLCVIVSLNLRSNRWVVKEDISETHL